MSRLNAAKILAIGGTLSSLLVGIGGLLQASAVISVAGFVMFTANVVALVWRDRTSS
jgi:hypothetical protein